MISGGLENASQFRPTRRSREAPEPKSMLAMPLCLASFPPPLRDRLPRGAFQSTHFMANVTEIRKGMAIRQGGDVVVVTDVTHRTPGNLRAFVQIAMRSIKTGKTLPSLHSSKFAPVPEPTLRTGVTAMSAAVLELIGKK